MNTWANPSTRLTLFLLECTQRPFIETFSYLGRTKGLFFERTSEIRFLWGDNLLSHITVFPWKNKPLKRPMSDPTLDVGSTLRFRQWGRRQRTSQTSSPRRRSLWAKWRRRQRRITSRPRWCPNRGWKRSHARLLGREHAPECRTLEKRADFFPIFSWHYSGGDSTLYANMKAFSSSVLIIFSPVGVSSQSSLRILSTWPAQLFSLFEQDFSEEFISAPDRGGTFLLHIRPQVGLLFRFWCVCQLWWMGQEFGSV